MLPPADYQVVTEEELIESVSFLAYRRVSTTMIVPGEAGSTVEMVTVDPLDLQAAQEEDAAIRPPGRWRATSVTRLVGS